jgi:AcrR family transcriptional regulator
MPEKLTLRERKKIEARAKVLSVAVRMFRRDSFDATTLDSICAGAEISKRTFFRYFRDKESLIFPHREERLAAFVAFLGDHEQVENPFDALRQATSIFGVKYNQNKGHLLAQQAIILSSPALLAREREIDLDWARAIANALSARTGNRPEGDLWARVLAGAIMGVVRSTMTYWFERNGEDDLSQLGLDALDFMERGFPSSVGGAGPEAIGQPSLV